MADENKVEEIDTQEIDNNLKIKELEEKMTEIIKENEILKEQNSKLFYNLTDSINKSQTEETAETVKDDFDLTEFINKKRGRM